jgi:dTDP-4-amino-4,6-dideoxygalactose transaminase
VFLSSGKEAITKALDLLDAVRVAIPSYTCERVLQGTLAAKCEPYIVDCGKDLQIDLESLSKFKGDTVIVPHMFGIKVDIKPIKDMGFNVVEDCSQCLGLEGLGDYSDYVIVSVGKSKWLPVGGGGILIGDECRAVKFSGTYTDFSRASEMVDDIPFYLQMRIEAANELLNAGVDLIGKDRENAWMRGMYFTENQKRIPYPPIHEMYGDFKCPIVDSFKDKLDWISIFA